jgi:hypothetical protein
MSGEGEGAGATTGDVKAAPDAGRTRAPCQLTKSCFRMPAIARMPSTPKVCTSELQGGHRGSTRRGRVWGARGNRGRWSGTGVHSTAGQR